MAERFGLRRLSADAVRGRDVSAVDGETRDAAAAIVDDVMREDESALRRYAERFDALPPDAPLVLGRRELDAALDSVAPGDRGLLERTAARIRDFAEAQRGALTALEVPVAGGRAGHTIEPIERAGCYAPGGRFPLISSVLMTAVTARAAGCDDVVVASPSRSPLMLAAAAVGGADAYLCAGGAHAIAAMARGIEGVTKRDLICGPGNRWVTAAKHVVSDRVGIDMLAGPSELVVVADAGADPAVVAADLLAQAEHDTDASAILVTTDPAVADATEFALAEQLATLPTRETAQAALGNGFTCVVKDREEARRMVDEIAPEHLELMIADAPGFARGVRHAGAVFVGAGSAEVLGDYGLGPNHTLPTGGTARRAAGLSVFTFLRVRTFIEVDRADDATVRDAAALARLEGLEAHARSAERRLAGG